MRTFIAVEVDEKLKEVFGKVQSEIYDKGAKIKWVSPQNMHMTLKFIGETKIEQAEEIKNILRICAGETKRFSMNFKSAGVFPDYKKPRVVWAGVSEGKQELVSLAKKIEDSLSPVGIPGEKRVFSAHMTLGRIKFQDSPALFIQALRTFEQTDFGTMTASQLVFFKSDLRKEGPVYEKLATFEFSL